MSTCTHYFVSYFLLVSLLSFGPLRAQGESVYTTVESLLPDNFPAGNSYTVRYVSEQGIDNNTCLESQPYPVPRTAEIPHCKTLRYALFGNHNYRNNRSVSNLIVLLEPGKYAYGNESIVLQYFANLVISKVPHTRTQEEVILYCQKQLEQGFNNIYITYSNYVAINEVVFEECGPLSPGVGIKEVNWLTVSNSIARNNFHSGIVIFQSLNTTIINCTFHSNNGTAAYNISSHLSPGEIRFSAGLSLSWRNVPNPLGSVIDIINCEFINNTASLSHLNANDTRPILYIPQGHAGAISAHFANTTNHVLRIDNTTIRGNTARFNGGGAFFSFYNNAQDNLIAITNSCFEDNESLLGAGGGVSMSTFNMANNNRINMTNVDFRNNHANLGGGGCSLNIQDQLINLEELMISNVAWFENCLFESNWSPEGGSAVSLVSNARVDQALDTTNFVDCTFLNNTATEDGAVLSLRFPVKFTGRTVFKFNRGGGAVILQTRMDVGGWAWFEGNTAERGGAIFLRDQSVLQVLRGANLTFIGNSATRQGGAIAVIAPSVGLDTDIIRLFNTRCFIQFDVLNVADATPPSDWNASFAFIDNRAELNGAAIYATDLNRCTYTPSINATGTKYVNEKSIFSVDGLFYFSGNTVSDNITNINMSVASSPSDLLINFQEVSGAPGEVIEFEVRATDQSGNWRRAVWSLHDNSVTMDPTEGVDYFVLTPGGNTHPYTVPSSGDPSLYDNCSTNETLHNHKIDFNIVQIIAGDIAGTTTSTVNVTCCHPGYVFNTDRSECEYDRRTKVILRGDPNNRYLYIQPEHYAAVREGKLVSAAISSTFQNCSSQGTLRGCLFKFDSVDEQCNNNRTGFLCGSCPEGQKLDLTLRVCRECTATDSVVLTVILVLFVVAAVLVLVFNIGVPNDLKGCFFFVQVVSFVYQASADENANWDFHLSRALASFYIPLCPVPSYKAYVTASYGLLISVLSFGTIVVYVVCAQFIRKLSHRSSLEGIWLLSFVTMKYAADTAFLILRCQKVTGEDVYGEFVYFYDGTIQCFVFDWPNTHLAFAIAAIFLLLAVVLGIVAIGVISYRRFKHTQAFTDILTIGVEESRRWWSAFDFFRRLLIVLVALILNYVQPDYTQLAQFSAIVIIFFVFACAQPYKEKRANIIEAVILLDLLVLTALFLNTADQSQDDVNNLAAVLLVLPFLFGLGYIAVNVIRFVWNKCSPTSFMKFCGQVKHLLMRGMWREKVKGGISHDLDRFVNVTKNEQGEVVQTDLNDSTEFATDYAGLREELLDI